MNMAIHTGNGSTREAKTEGTLQVQEHSIYTTLRHPSLTGATQQHQGEREKEEEEETERKSIRERQLAGQWWLMP